MIPLRDVYSRGGACAVAKFIRQKQRQDIKGVLQETKEPLSVMDSGSFID